MKEAQSQEGNKAKQYNKIIAKEDIDIENGYFMNDYVMMKQI